MEGCHAMAGRIVEEGVDWADTYKQLPFAATLTYELDDSP